MARTFGLTLAFLLLFASAAYAQVNGGNPYPSEGAAWAACQEYAAYATAHPSSPGVVTICTDEDAHTYGFECFGHTFPYNKSDNNGAIGRGPGFCWSGSACPADGSPGDSGVAVDDPGCSPEPMCLNNCKVRFTGVSVCMAGKMFGDTVGAGGGCAVNAAPPSHTPPKFCATKANGESVCIKDAPPGPPCMETSEHGTICGPPPGQGPGSCNAGDTGIACTSAPGAPPPPVPSPPAPPGTPPDVQTPSIHIDNSTHTTNIYNFSGQTPQGPDYHSDPRQPPCAYGPRTVNGCPPPPTGSCPYGFNPDGSCKSGPAPTCQYGANPDGSCKGAPTGTCQFGAYPDGTCKPDPNHACPNGTNPDGSCKSGAATCQYGTNPDGTCKGPPVSCQYGTNADGSCKGAPSTCAYGTNPDGSCAGNPNGCPNGTYPDGTCKSGQGNCLHGSNPDGTCKAGSGSASGDCAAPPACSGDAVLCTIVLQDWKGACAVKGAVDSEKSAVVDVKDAVNGLGEKLTGIGSTLDDIKGDMGGIKDLITDMDKTSDLDTSDPDAGSAGDAFSGDAEKNVDELDSTGYGLPRECPVSVVNLSLSVGSFAADFTSFCDLLAIGGQLLMVMAAIASLRIISGGIS